jgi:hypothetical protein
VTLFPTKANSAGFGLFMMAFELYGTTPAHETQWAPNLMTAPVVPVGAPSVLVDGIGVLEGSVGCAAGF